MSVLVALLTFMAVSTTVSVIICEFTGALSASISVFSLVAGAAAGVWLGTKCRDLKGAFPKPDVFDWVLGLCFLLFCYRFFFWMLFPKGPGLYTLDANNFGDLPWHVTAITNLAHARFWPENPIFVGEKFHYPYGIDMFNALWLKLGVPLTNSIPVVGFVCGLLALAALFLWGRGFVIGSFLFSGGIAGYRALTSGVFSDYQANLAWKSLPLAVYLTQRGFLFALPAGLLIVWSWRRRFITNEKPLPIVVEGLLWGLMPLFHVHTFIFLSFLFAVWVVARKKYKDGAKLLAWAFWPATYEMIRLTDAFKKSSMISFKPGWMIGNENILSFFWINYGFYLPLALAALVLAIHKKDRERLLLILPAAALYGLCLFVMFAPWDWDNTKLMIWAYLLALPVMWDLILKKASAWFQAIAMTALFFSGFVCVYSAYSENNSGFMIYDQSVVEQVCGAIDKLPHEGRFATAQIQNHPVMLCGHMVVAGYAGHLWSQGAPHHEIVEDKLRRLMTGESDWQILAKEIQARYLFWGPAEIQNYPSSPKPWEAVKVKIAEGPWGKIYDLGDSK